jgi:hypothetical protein
MSLQALLARPSVKLSTGLKFHPGGQSPLCCFVRMVVARMRSETIAVLCVVALGVVGPFLTFAYVTPGFLLGTDRGGCNGSIGHGGFVCRIVAVPPWTSLCENGSTESYALAGDIFVMHSWKSCHGPVAGLVGTFETPTSVVEPFELTVGGLPPTPGWANWTSSSFVVDWPWTESYNVTIGAFAG